MPVSHATPRSGGFGSIARLLINKKFWGLHFFVVILVSAVGLAYMGRATYVGAPPVADFRGPDGALVISAEQIDRGKEVFHLRGLMSYGSFWGDGAELPLRTRDAIAAPVPRGQKALIDLLFVLCAIVGVGSLLGIYSGQTGFLTGSAAYWFGSQGWEFMEMGRAFQILLLMAFSLWIAIIWRGIRPWLTRRNLWSVPAWLLYGSGVMVFFLFFGLFTLPQSNFAIADFWRWMVVHMWVEVTFEVFTTVVVAYMLVQMGLINRVMAERVIFLAVYLFMATATLGWRTTSTGSPSPPA